MENIVTITLLTLTLFGKIEMTTFEIPNTRETIMVWMVLVEKIQTAISL